LVNQNADGSIADQGTVKLDGTESDDQGSRSRLFWDYSTPALRHSPNTQTTDY